MKIQMNNMYLALLKFGANAGCHQLPERSFIINGYQFPVCARCTGVLIGYIICLLCHFIFGTNLIFCFAGCLIMFIDWFIQYLNIKESTNIRRFVTGILGGFGVMGIQIIFLKAVIKMGISLLTRL